MAVPAVPTVLSLVTEGLRQAGIFNPTQTQLSIYQTEVMEQLKNDLWKSCKEAKPLMTFSYLVLVPGQSRYSCPSDFASDMTMVILTGLTTGTAVSATTSTLTTPALVGPLTLSQTLGKDIAITGGTAAASVSQVIGVVNNPNGTTTLTVYPNFQATPDATSVFMLVDNQWPVEQDHIANFDKYRTAGVDRPRKFYPMGDEGFDEFALDVAPDNNYLYVLRMRYYVNVMTLDLTSSLMSTLYQKFREYWIYGVKAQALSDNDDTRWKEALMLRDSKLQEIIMSQQYGTNIHTLREHVEDYQ